MNALRTPLTALAVVLALSACSSTAPLHYYSLEMAAPATTGAHASAASLVHVRHVSLPSDMDHRGLTHSQSATQLAISDADQWSAPLADLIQGAVSRDLGERLGYEHVVAPAALPLGSQPSAVVTLVDLDFVTLDADASCSVSAQVNWTLTATGAAPRRGTARLNASASGCPAGLPAALSVALGALADQLAPQLSP